MKKFLILGVLLNSLCALASSTVPAVFQYWFDNDEIGRVKSTSVYSNELNPLTIDAGSLTEGGHALNYRWANEDGQWGGIMTKYFTVPSAPEKSSSKPIAYRLWLNNEVIYSGVLSDALEFTITPEFPENPTLGVVNNRAFKYFTGEKQISMDASGKFLCAFQMLSEGDAWGMPMYSEFDHSASTKLSVDSVPIPYDYTFSKPDNNSFKAYRFFNSNNSVLYFKASQDCSMGIYSIDTSSPSNLALLKTFDLKKGETTKYDDSKIDGKQIIAILYDSKKDAANQDDDVFLRIMFDDNRLPKPVIMFDPQTWEVTFTCADQRAMIHYTLDGSIPTHESPVYDADVPVKLEKFTKVKAIAVYGDLGDSWVAEATFDGHNMRVPAPQLEFAGGAKVNEFIFTNALEGVTTYYLTGTGNLKDDDLHDETLRKTFDGNPFEIEDGTSLKAYSVREGLADSEVLSLTVNLNDYVTQSPKLVNTKTEGENEVDYNEIRNFVQLSVPEGKAKYRILQGKQEFQFSEEIKDEEWLDYDEGWIELPGGPFSGNQTVQAFAMPSDGKARSAVVSFYTDWVKALRPTADYDNYRLKLSSQMPGGHIYYCVDVFDESTAIEYAVSENPEEIDMKDKTVVYAYVVAEGYTRSELLTIYRDNFNLAIPGISYNDDGVLEISHPDNGVELVVTVDPEQEYETVESNLIRFTPQYGTNVSAYARKDGYNDSGKAEMKALTKPVITVDGYKVTIDGPGEIYYTRDGSLPTKKSSPYLHSPFETSACTIRAAAFMDGYIPSEADAKKVMDQVAKPTVIVVDGFAKLSTETEGATIYYSLDQNISDESREVYDEKMIPNGIDISQAKTLYAYAEAEGYRRSETLDYPIGAYTLTSPRLRYEPGTDEMGFVVADHDDTEVSIRFTDEDGNALISEPDSPRKVKVGYNSIVYAYATRMGYVESKPERLGHTDPPTFSLDLFTVTINSKDGQTVYYTIDGKTPTTTSTKYEKIPFKVSDNCMVRAVAFADGLIPAEAQPLTIGYRKAEIPRKETYDGRFVTFAAEDGAKLRYVLGEEGDLLSSNVVDPGTPIDMEGLNKISVIAQLADADDSEPAEYQAEFYANETDAYTSRPGVLEEAFGWCDDIDGFETLNIHGSLNANSQEDSGDYAFIRTMKNLRHLDLTQVSDVMVPDSAFAGMKLVSVTFPETMRNAGSGIFGEDNSWLCAVQLPSQSTAPANLLAGVTNSNLLLFARNRTLVESVLNNTDGIISNMVTLESYNGEIRADEVKLTQGKPFYSPREFKATNISFTRTFSKETPIGGIGSGWETMVVPFDVQTVTTNDRRSFKPFGQEDTDNGVYPFWLFRADGTKWKNETMIMANVPYLLSFPNNPFYTDHYCVNGNVIFSASNVQVKETPAGREMSYSFGGGNYLEGNYEWVDKSQSVLVLNEAPKEYQSKTYQPGGIFISGERDIPPFECYVESNGARAIPVFDQSAVDELLGDYGTHIWSESCAICIRSGIAMKLRIYDVVGQLIRIVDVKAGETVRVDGITPGIYFVANTKILVKG